ncbi:MAG: site-2 protease family protein [Victivallales bacterium]|nr:site-2 protease family protein [Victivallales bacterium]
MNLFIMNLFSRPQLFFTWMLIVVFSICCHEYMHAYVAMKEGDVTAADAGHLTLNPFRQMGWFSLVMLAFVGIAWGAVPVRPQQMRHRHSDALVSFAGPATNLGLFVLFGVLAFWTKEYHIGSDFSQRMLLLGSLLNIVLFMLNMLPIPGLDGWSILRSFFSRIGNLNSELMNGIFFVLFFLIFFASDLLWTIGKKMTDWLLYWISYIL